MESESRVQLERFHTLKSALLATEMSGVSELPSADEIERATGAFAVSLGLLVDLADGLRAELITASAETMSGRDFADAVEQFDEVSSYLRGAASRTQIAHVRLQDQSRTSEKFVVDRLLAPTATEYVEEERSAANEESHDDIERDRHADP